MKKYLVFAYIIGMLAATTLMAQAGGVWQEVTGGGMHISQNTTGLIQAGR